MYYNALKEEDSCGAKYGDIEEMCALTKREKCEIQRNLDEKNTLITISAGFFIAFCQKFTGKLICFHFFTPVILYKISIHVFGVANQTAYKSMFPVCC